MTLITVTSSHNALKNVESLIQDIETDESIQTSISEYRADSLDFDQTTTILAVFFSGTIAIVQIINLLINLQQKKTPFTNPIEINIKTIHDHEKTIKISHEISEIEAQSIREEISKFIQDCSSKSLDVKAGNIHEIQYILSELEKKLVDIKIKEVNKPKKYKDKIVALGSSFKQSNFTDLVFHSTTKDIYLDHEQAQQCKKIFFLLEESRILLFQEISDDFYMMDLQKILVRYKVYKLDKFIGLSM